MIGRVTKGLAWRKEFLQIMFAMANQAPVARVMRSAHSFQLEALACRIEEHVREAPESAVTIGCRWSPATPSSPAWCSMTEERLEEEVAVRPMRTTAAAVALGMAAAAGAGCGAVLAAQQGGSS